LTARATKKGRRLRENSGKGSVGKEVVEVRKGYGRGKRETCPGCEKAKVATLLDTDASLDRNNKSDNQTAG